MKALFRDDAESKDAVRYGQLLGHMAILVPKKNPSAEDQRRAVGLMNELKNLNRLPEMRNPSPRTWYDAMHGFMRALDTSVSGQQDKELAAMSASLYQKRTVVNVRTMDGRLTLECSNNVLSVFTNAVQKLADADRRKLEDLIQFKSVGW